jgi:hypothetical protein
MKVDGYQTLEDRDNITEVEQNGPFICERKDAWLGAGYYFWDTNIEWAKNWGEGSYIKNSKGYIIGHSKLNLENCFDLFGNVSHQLDLQNVYDVLIKSGKLMGGKPKVSDCLTYLQRIGLFDFDCVRSTDFKKTGDDKIFYTDKNREFMSTNQRVQICVIDKNKVLLSPFKVVYSEKYKQA